MFAFSCLVYAAATWWASVALPEGPIPTHWSGFGGAPADGWSSRSGAMWFLAGLGVFLGGMFAGFIALFLKFDSLPGLNVPNKEYWLKPENLPEARRRSISAMAQFGWVTMLWMATIPIAIVQAAQTPDGRSPGWDGAVFALWCVFMVVWTIRMITAWRIPPQEPQGPVLRN